MSKHTWLAGLCLAMAGAVGCCHAHRACAPPPAPVAVAPAPCPGTAYFDPNAVPAAPVPAQPYGAPAPCPPGAPH